jgi:hypothetical protein
LALLRGRRAVNRHLARPGEVADKDERSRYVRRSSSGVVCATASTGTQKRSTAPSMPHPCVGRGGSPGASDVGEWDARNRPIWSVRPPRSALSLSRSRASRGGRSHWRHSDSHGSTSPGGSPRPRRQSGRTGLHEQMVGSPASSRARAPARGEVSAMVRSCGSGALGSTRSRTCRGFVREPVRAYARDAGAGQGHFRDHRRCRSGRQRGRRGCLCSAPEVCSRPITTSALTGRAACSHTAIGARASGSLSRRLLLSRAVRASRRREFVRRWSSSGPALLPTSTTTAASTRVAEAGYPARRVVADVFRCVCLL